MQSVAATVTVKSSTQMPMELSVLGCTSLFFFFFFFFHLQLRAQRSSESTLAWSLAANVRDTLLGVVSGRSIRALALAAAICHCQPLAALLPPSHMHMQMGVHRELRRRTRTWWFVHIGPAAVLVLERQSRRRRGTMQRKFGANDVSRAVKVLASGFPGLPSSVVNRVNRRRFSFAATERRRKPQNGSHSFASGSPGRLYLRDKS
ncbi:hypothetical protein C8F01DRAFT_1366602 [Mycena amicta]|nr:hypothetical protein C8F01DRAFT_1366602 [Mycena amicta]